MEKNALSDIEARLLEVNQIIQKLDPSIRVAAFEFLKPYVASGEFKQVAEHSHKPQSPEGEQQLNTGDLEALVSQHSSDKPSDNARLLSAHWYSLYGKAPFSIKWIRKTGAKAGLTIPDSPDMTYRQAAEEGKSLYRAVGKGGMIEITVAGEQYLKKEYKVKKGTQAPPSA